MEAQALYARGWTRSAIARHLGINRRTVREYLKGQQLPGQRVRSEPEVFAPFAEYARLRLADDPHLRQAEELRDQVLGAAFRLAYSCRLSAISCNVEDDAGSVTGWRGQVELGLRPVQLL